MVLIHNLLREPFISFRGLYIENTSDVILCIYLQKMYRSIVAVKGVIVRTVLSFTFGVLYELYEVIIYYY